MKRKIAVVFFCLFSIISGAGQVRAAEVILQYFGTTWMEIARRMPELAEAGYTAMWLPPPQKASSTLSVGFDTCDRFDLGDKPRNSLPTMYGSKADLLHMMDVAHRFGIRVYFDNIMAHTGGFMPEGEPYELNDLGFVPADFHILRREDGTYYKIDWPDWNNEWEVLYRNPFSWDIANDPGDWNNNFGSEERARTQKWHGIRHPDNPEFYLDTDLPITIIFEAGGTTHTQVVHTFSNKEPFQDAGYTNSQGEFVASAAGNGRFDWEDLNGNGIHDPDEPSEPFEDTGLFPGRPDRRTPEWGYGDGRYNMGNPVSEQVNQMLDRSIRWLTDKTHADGYRLDAVKHVRSEFFGDAGPAKDYSNEGYTGQIQLQHNLTHGYDDWANHRDSVFVQDRPRNDAMLYGEHLNAPPAEGPYLERGMRIANDWFLNSIGHNIENSLEFMDQRGYGIFNNEPFHVAHYVMSHDNNYLKKPDRKLAHAALLGRESLAIVYTDGYHQSTEKQNYFPKPAEVPFLGQFGNTWMLNLLEIRRQFGWGPQWARGSTTNISAWSRGPAETGDQTFMIFAMARRLAEEAPAYEGDALFPEGAVLHRYSSAGEQPVMVKDGKIRELDGSPVLIEPGTYSAFTWAAPGMPAAEFGERLPIEILQDGEPVPAILVARRDGTDGDPAFNPHDLPNDNPTNFTYMMPVPHVTSPDMLTFVARADGSAENIMMKLNGGIDLNAQIWPGQGRNAELGARDNPPGEAHDLYLGYEQMKFARRSNLSPDDDAENTDVPSVFPFSLEDIARRQTMETRFEITNFNAGTIAYFPHNNWGDMKTGLDEGFHVLRTKTFLASNDLCRVPLYRERVQTFYYDTKPPEGRILSPAADAPPAKGATPFVVRTDMTVTEVWYRTLADADAPHPWKKAVRDHAGAPRTDGALEQEWHFKAKTPAARNTTTVEIRLLEASSSRDFDLSDEAGHYTTLARAFPASVPPEGAPGKAPPGSQ